MDEGCFFLNESVGHKPTEEIIVHCRSCSWCQDCLDVHYEAYQKKSGCHWCGALDSCDHGELPAGLSKEVFLVEWEGVRRLRLAKHQENLDHYFSIITEKLQDGETFDLFQRCLQLQHVLVSGCCMRKLILEELERKLKALAGKLGRGSCAYLMGSSFRDNLEKLTGDWPDSYLQPYRCLFLGKT